VIRSLALVALLATSAQAIAATISPKAEPALSSTAPWWEKVTVTIAGDGKSNCRYETSLVPDGSDRKSVV